MQPTVRVTAENFARAETDRYFLASVNQAGGVGRFHHFRDVMPIDNQTVVRANRDTLYSSAVFDLDAGPVTITLPNSGKRFMSMMMLDEDEYAFLVVYGTGSYRLTREEVGTRYMMAAVRTLVDLEDPDDLARVHALQDAIRVDQQAAGRFEIPRWDPASQRTVRDALVTLGSTIPDSTHMFGARDAVDPLRHLIGAAMAWGGNPAKDAVYLNVTPAENDGGTIYRLTVREVPVDGFWSISVYNAKGYFEPNAENAYTINNLTAKTADDGSITIQFGGSDESVPNRLPITPGWNYLVRLYQPHRAILDGTWTFPEAQPVR